MRSKPGLFPLVYVIASAAAVGCGSSADDPNVDFGSSTPIGRWQTASAGTGATEMSTVRASAGSAAAGSSAQPSSGSATGSGTVGGTSISGSAGRSVTAAAGSSSGRAGSQASGGSGAMVSASGGSGGAGAPAAGSGGTAGTTDPGGSGGDALASLSFDVTTSPVGYRYQPKNVGAIWIQDESGKLVKSLEVWAATRRRYLTRYASALAGGSVDVTASATLGSHKTHHVTWNLKDRSGAAAPAGKYTLVIELTDGDQTGRTSTVDFDTSAGATSMSPADAPSFSAMKLQLQ